MKIEITKIKTILGTPMCPRCGERVYRDVEWSGAIWPGKCPSYKDRDVCYYSCQVCQIWFIDPDDVPPGA